jgi:hypothetical protein
MKIQGPLPPLGMPPVITVVTSLFPRMCSWSTPFTLLAPPDADVDLPTITEWAWRTVLEGGIDLVVGILPAVKPDGSAISLTSSLEGGGSAVRVDPRHGVLVRTPVFASAQDYVADRHAIIAMAMSHAGADRTKGFPGGLIRLRSGVEGATALHGAARSNWHRRPRRKTEL